ncbi:MAG: hypothetical protein LBK97_05830 [Prevotellaceae bacterium]|jgi:hypothetical protein|nr:hypothetical protein [Prevotellaceae bacterium]
MNDILKKSKNNIFGLGIIFVSMISTGIFMQSCNNESDNLSVSPTVDSQEANRIASNYLELIDDQYVLNLSEKKAMSLGISRSDYARMQTEIIQANAFIIECQKDGIKVELNDNKEVDIPKIRLKEGSENKNFACQFTLPSNGSNGSASVFIPPGKKKVKIVTTMTCLIGTCSGSVNCGGATSAYTISGISGGSTIVNLPMSNTNMTITGKTLCSGGGTLSASFMDE